MYNRLITQHLVNSLQDTPVLIVVGARQVGKSTLLKNLLPIKTTYVTLDDISTLSAARTDPGAFLSMHKSKTVVIDEAQLAPELMRTIKKVVDENRESGRFILSGSADIMTLPKLSESLAGRSEIFYMYPLSRSEILGKSGIFIDSIFATDFQLNQHTDCDFSHLANILYYGGYPEVLERKIERVSPWFKSYITAIIQRDMRNVSHISDITSIQKILELLARRSGNLLNVSDISRLSGVKNTTLQRYLSILETVFFIYRNKPWHKTIDAKLTKSPKVYMNDTGMLCYLLGISLDDLIYKKSSFTEAIVENFVFNELQKQISWSHTKPDMYHFRTTNGEEVDIILESRNNKKIGIEIKSASSVTANDFEGLKKLQSIIHDDFHRGIVLYAGNDIIQFASNMFAIPITCIYE